MMTIQLTDDEHRQSATTGHIVVDGEQVRAVSDATFNRHSLREWTPCKDQCPHAEHQMCYSPWRACPGVRLVLPAKWRPATEPCDCVKAGTDTTWIRCTKCLDGIHRVVTLTATCPTCDGEGLTMGYGRTHPCERCDGSGKVTLGRFTIQALPVSDGWKGEWDVEKDGPAVVVLDPPWTDETGFVWTVAHYKSWDVYEPLTLDPLPQPGQFVLVFTEAPT